MPNLEMSDWLMMAAPAVLIVVLLGVLKRAYSAKEFVPLPQRKPAFCLLPKFTMSLPLTPGDPEQELAARLGEYGFRQVRRNDHSIVFARGSALGDISIKIVKLVAAAPLPVANPAELTIEYGAAFGVAFDTGDLWKFCSELRDKVAAAVDRHNAPAAAETGNPYQPPREAVGVRL